MIKDRFLWLLLMLVACSCRKEIVADKTTNSGFHIFGGGGMEIPFRILRNSDGGYTICATSNSFNGGSQDAFIIRLDRNLDLLWKKNYGGPALDITDCVIETKDGGLLVSGTTLNGGIDPLTGKKFKEPHPILFKLDNAGNLQWEKHLKMTPGIWDMIFEILEEKDDTYSFLGQAYIKSYTRPTIIKTDKQGNIINFTKNVVGKSFASCYNATKTPDNTYAGVGFISDGKAMNFSYFKFDNRDSIVGYKLYDKIPYDSFHRTYNIIRPLPDNNYLLGAGFEKFILLIKIDGNGNRIWSKNITVKGGPALLHNVRVSATGEIYIMGRTSENLPSYMYLVKLDAEGNKLFEKLIQPDIYSSAEDFLVEDNGEITVVGYLAEEKSENTDIMVFRLDKNGDIIYD